jgi:ABC-type Fe3+-siderophore transport system permease subunit
MPVGILTAIIGGPLFIFLLKRNAREKKGAAK